MAGKSDYLENKVLDHILGDTAYAAPATLYIGLYTAVPTDGGGGTEVTGSGYARVAVTNDTTNFPNASGGTKSNGTAITFASAGAAWGTVVAVGIFDALTGGNLLFWAPLVSSRTVNIGDVVGFAVGQLQFIED